MADPKQDQREKWTPIPGFTPGPWGVEPENGTHEIGPSNWKLRVFAHNPGPDLDFHVAVVRNADTPTRAANAALIAQAPRMYEKLAKVREVFANLALDTAGTPSEQYFLEAEREVVAVLAAARGEQG